MHSLNFLNSLYIDKDYKGLLSLYENDCEERAKVLLLCGEYKESASIYLKLGMLFEAGYCYLLNGELDKAEAVWDNLGEENSWLIWGRILIKTLRGQLDEYPTYLQLRNFLEVEMSIFIEHKRYDFIERILKSLDTFLDVNLECYKYVGRVFLNYGHPEKALVYFLKFKEISANDPEIQYLLAKNYMALDMPSRAEAAIQKCLQENPNYYPAKAFFEE